MVKKWENKGMEDIGINTISDLEAVELSVLRI